MIWNLYLEIGETDDLKILKTSREPTSNFIDLES